MESLRTDVICGACQKSFSVELTRMRLNLQHVCPNCGSVYSVSEKDAIRAHRVLEELERRMKCAGCVSGRAAPLDASARLRKCFYLSAFAPATGKDLCEAV